MRAKYLKRILFKKFIRRISFYSCLGHIMRYFVASYLSICDRLCSTSKEITNALTGTCLEGHISGNKNSKNT